MISIEKAKEFFFTVIGTNIKKQNGSSIIKNKIENNFSK